MSVLALLAAGCAAKQPWSSVAHEVYVASLPLGADVYLDDRLIGTSPVTVPLAGVPGERKQRPAVLRLEKEGFAPERWELDRTGAPSNLSVILRPIFDEGVDVPPPPEPDDADGLYELGAALVRADRCADAATFLQRVLELEPRFARAHRELATCLRAAGDPKAAGHFSRYLLLAPDARDAKEIQGILDSLRTDRTIN